MVRMFARYKWWRELLRGKWYLLKDYNDVLWVNSNYVIKQHQTIIATENYRDDEKNYATILSVNKGYISGAFSSKEELFSFVRKIAEEDKIDSHLSYFVENGKLVASSSDYIKEIIP